MTPEALSCDPRDPKYKSVEDLPDGLRPFFIDLPDGGFVLRSAYLYQEQAKDLFRKNRDPKAFMDHIHDIARGENYFRTVSLRILKMLPQLEKIRHAVRRRTREWWHKADTSNQIYDAIVNWDNYGWYGASAIPIFESQLEAERGRQVVLDPGETRSGVRGQTSLVENFKKLTGFREKDKRLKIERDSIGFVRRRADGSEETYLEKLEREGEKGSREAASYGLASIGEQEVVLYAMNWDFFAGTLGVVAGQKFIRAAELASREKLPLIAIFSSGGARQQENIPGLFQMPGIAYAIDEFKKRTRRPYISILNHQVWGGISASAVPLGDVIVALEGTDFGFAGKRVIQSYQREEIPEGAQTAENHFAHRNIDLMVRDEKELISWLTRFLTIVESHEQDEGETSTRNENARSIETPGEDIYFDPNGLAYYATPEDLSFWLTQQHLREISRRAGFEQMSDLYDLFYRFLVNDTRRPTTEFIMSRSFDNFVPFYSRYTRDDTLCYPAIIAGLGRIEDQLFLIIGDQPSYKISGDSLMKIPASPTPKDLIYLRRMLDFGSRLGVPAVFLTDTLGAKPTIDTEISGQPNEIANTIRAVNSYPYPAISIITGVLGSGGGLVTTPVVDHVAMLSNAMAFVAEPRSATTILMNQANPSPDEIRRVINGLRVTAQDQLKLGLIDEVLDEPTPVNSDPELIAKEIRRHIVGAYSRLASHTAAETRKRRRKKIHSFTGFMIDK